MPRSLPLLSALGSLAASVALVSLSACGEPARDLREWTPADHQPAPEGSGVPEPGDEEEPSNAGAALYGVHCATCHGPTGHGDGPGAPPMARVPDLSDPELAARRTDADVEAIILNGRGFMPGFERSIPIEGIRAIVAHVRTLAPITAVAPLPDAMPGDAPTEAAAGEAAPAPAAPPPGAAPAAPEALPAPTEPTE